MNRFLVITSALLLLGCGEETRPPAPSLEEEPAPAVAAPGETERAEVVPELAEVAPVGPPPEVPRPYEEGVDAQAQIDAAVARASADGKSVLLMFGANWCVWCRRLTWVFQNEPRVRAALAQGWHVVHVDTGTRGSGTNRAVIERYGDPVRHGLPCLVVLDAAGALAHTQETGSLESGDRHDPALVLAFLARQREPD